MILRDLQGHAATAGLLNGDLNYRVTLC